VICVIFGTTGELIKLAPVLVRIRAAGGTYYTATTGQQVQQIPRVLDQLGLPQPDLWLGRGVGGRDLHSNGDIPRWLASIWSGFLRHRRGLRVALRRDGAPPLVIVHGDTMTTLLGSLMGRALRAPVAHVEAGVRTWDLRHPFPEEGSRRLVSKIARLHYAPGAEAASNIRRGIVVDTGMNTIRDSLELAPDDVELPPAVAGKPFGVASLHRYELLNDRGQLRKTFEALASHPAQHPILFVDHPVTMAAMQKHGLSRVFDGSSVTRMHRLDFFGFVALLRRAAFAVTDSGGTQVESYVLDKPCLVHRKKVEQPDGIGENVVVSGWDIAVLERFLDDPFVHRRLKPPPPVSPSDVIVRDLRERGYLRTGSR
jgi:UDP-N-acetylglucosamine 2-epimerase (non-hydrolysing)